MFCNCFYADFLPPGCIRDSDDVWQIFVLCHTLWFRMCQQSKMCVQLLGVKFICFWGILGTIEPLQYDLVSWSFYGCFIHSELKNPPEHFNRKPSSEQSYITSLVVGVRHSICSQQCTRSRKFKIDNLFKSDHIIPLDWNNGILQSAEEVKGEDTCSLSMWHLILSPDGWLSARASTCSCVECVAVNMSDTTMPSPILIYTHVFSSVSSPPSVCLTIDLNHSKWLIPFK